MALGTESMNANIGASMRIHHVKRFLKLLMILSVPHVSWLPASLYSSNVYICICICMYVYTHQLLYDHICWCYSLLSSVTMIHPCAHRRVSFHNNALRVDLHLHACEPKWDQTNMLSSLHATSRLYV